MPRITIVPVSGLGNRMRVVASAVKMAADMNVHIRVVWQPAWDCRAGFDDLFLPLSFENVSLCRGTFMDAPATKDNLLLPMLLRKSCYQAEYRCFRPTETVSLQSLIGRGHSSYMDTCYALCNYSHELFRECFRLRPELERQVEDTVSGFSSRTLGVHVRRSDNRQAIRYSPLTAFRQRIDALFDSGEAEQLFLSTDDNRVREFFRKTYGKHLITRRVMLDRNSLQGIRDAVIDLWCLSRTSRLLGSYYSSFSETAAELSDIPFEVVTRSLSSETNSGATN